MSYGMSDPINKSKVLWSTMDPHSSAQDVHRCDLCETTFVHSYCDFCQVNLCKPCIIDHIFDEYEKHKIVPFQKRRSTLIYPKCGTHPHKNCEFLCKDCNNIFVCSSCVTSEQHRNHKLEEIAEIYKTKKQTIEKEADQLKNHTFPTVKEIARDLENQLANLDGGYEKLTTTMSEQGEQWHREIDIIINKMKIEISEIKVKHRDILQKHLDEIKQIQSLIKQALLATEEIKNSNEVSSSIEFNSKTLEFSKLPPQVQILLPAFIPKPIFHYKLYSLFGQIAPLHVSTAPEKNILSLIQPNILFRELVDEPELIATIQTGHVQLHSVCQNKDNIWLRGLGQDTSIKCFNHNGSLLKTIETKPYQYPTDIVEDTNGHLIYSCFTSGTVNKVKNGQIEELIRFQDCMPGLLCVTSTGDLLVSIMVNDGEFETQCKVVRYSGSTEKQIIQFDEEGKPLYSGNANNKYITENRNHDICVADCKAGAVVVVNQDGKLRWRYTGHPSTKTINPFEPWGITTDSQSRILTTDYNNHCIHILDQNGRFLRYIDNCDLEYPTGLCVYDFENLFVCEFKKGNLKKIKYSKETPSYEFLM